MSETKHNFRISGKLKGSKRGGAFHGFCSETNAPIFGGANLIYALIWWSTTKDCVQKVCDEIKSLYPECDCFPEQLT